MFMIRSTTSTTNQIRHEIEQVGLEFGQVKGDQGKTKGNSKGRSSESDEVIVV